MQGERKYPPSLLSLQRNLSSIGIVDDEPGSDHTIARIPLNF